MPSLPEVGEKAGRKQGRKQQTDKKQSLLPSPSAPVSYWRNPSEVNRQGVPAMNQQARMLKDTGPCVRLLFPISCRREFQKAGVLTKQSNDPADPSLEVSDDLGARSVGGVGGAKASFLGQEKAETLKLDQFKRFDQEGREDVQRICFVSFSKCV